MDSTNKEVLSTLNDLIEVCKDGQSGFKTASEGVQNTTLKTMFSEFSLQRAKFSSELQAQAQTLGGEPTETGSTAGAVHRGWINIKAAITGKDEGAVISEAERGEDIAKEAYQKALKKDLPQDVRAVIEKQSKEVKAAHDRVRALERAHSAK